MNKLRALSTFLVDIEDLAKEHDIGCFVGIPEKLFEDGWYAIVRFEVGRPNSPPALGISVQDGIGTEDKFGGA